MSRKQAPAEEPVEPSRAAGACVLVVLGGVVVAVAFAVDEAAGVLLVVAGGTFALWRSARRLSVSSATPPPRGVAPDPGEAARRSAAKARGAYDPSGVMCTYHQPREEEAEPAADDAPKGKRLPLQARIERAFTAARGGDRR